MAVTRIPIPDWARNQTAGDRLELPLAETELSVRTVNCLEEQAIFTVRDLLNCTPERLLEIPNLGKKTLQAVYDALEKIGVYRPSRRSSEQPQGYRDHTLLRKLTDAAGQCRDARSAASA